MKGFDAAKRNLTVGTFVRARYEILAFTEARIEAERNATGKPVNVSARLLNRIWDATANGGTVARRTNGPDGISYTVAIEEIVVASLKLKLNETNRWESSTNHTR